MVAIIVDGYRRFFGVGGQGYNSDADGKEDDSCPALGTQGPAEKENGEDCCSEDLRFISDFVPEQTFWACDAPSAGTRPGNALGPDFPVPRTAACSRKCIRSPVLLVSTHPR